MADLEKVNTLAQRINREHRQVQAAFGKTLQHAKRAGELLVQAKERTPYGQWGRGSKQISNSRSGQRSITCESILAGPILWKKRNPFLI